MEKRVRLPTTRSEQEMGPEGDKFVEDRISQLPDEIVVSILSLLTITEAARTSVLCHRWERLWTFYTGCLNFDNSLFDVGMDLEQERPKYVRLVNKVLASLDVNGTSILDGFRFCFPLNLKQRHDIDKWIQFAMEKRVVKRIEFNLGGVDPSVNYTLKQPRGLRTFSALTSLHLAFLNVSEEVIHYFLSSSPLLEQLCVKYSRKLLNLKVTSAARELKYLEIFRCSDLENLEVSAPNLVSLKYFGRGIRLHVANVPQLAEVYIGRDVITYMSSSLSIYISRLETLTLDMDFLAGQKFQHFVHFSRLKHLVLRMSPSFQDSMLEWTSLLEASPILHKFTLEMKAPPRRCRRKINKGPKCIHQCLKVVEIVGFVGFVADVEFARYLIAFASRLEKIVLDRRCPIDIGKPWEMERAQKKIAAKQCALGLEKHLPPGVELVVI